MSSVLIISENDEGNPLAFELKREGHIVKVCSKNAKVFEGSLNPSRIQDPRKMLEQFDLVVSTLPQYTGGERTLCGGKFHTRVLQEEYLQDIRRVALPDTSQEERGHFSCFLTLWMSPKGVLPFHFLTLTYDRLCEGERGPKILAGSTHRLLKESKLFHESATLLLPLLEKVHFAGPLTLHLQLTQTELHLKELLPQPLFLQGMSELLRVPIFKLLWCSLTGEEIQAQSDELSLCVTLSCHEPVDLLYVQPQEQALPHVWLQSTQGTSQMLGQVSARGVTIKECQRRVSRTISFCGLDPEVMYREDIGGDADERFEWLRSAGWLE